MTMLSERQTAILGLVVREYIRTAQPVSSDALVRMYSLAYSSATVRNEMARLEEAGYLSHPHTSAGRVPLDQGYRFYVETLMEEVPIGADRQRTIRHQFHQAAHELGDQLQLAASVLASAVSNLGLATLPLAPAARLKQVQFVGLQERTALMVVVIQQGWSRQHSLELNEPAPQSDLARLSNRLNEALRRTHLQRHRRAPRRSGVARCSPLAGAPSPTRWPAKATTIRRTSRACATCSSSPNSAAPTACSASSTCSNERDLAQALPLDALHDGAISVVIGEENRHGALHDASIVVGRYTGPAGMSGALGVIGPTRMDYARAIVTVRYVADVMSELLDGLYGGGDQRPIVARKANMTAEYPAHEPPAGGHDDPTPIDAAPTLEQQLATEREKAERYLASWQRAQADFVNYKRRVEAERSDASRMATPPSSSTSSPSSTTSNAPCRTSTPPSPGSPGSTAYGSSNASSAASSRQRASPKSPPKATTSTPTSTRP